jgi:ATP-dependent helicase HrpB
MGRRRGAWHFSRRRPARRWPRRARFWPLGALDADGRITPHGRELVRLPLHPRLGHLVRKGGPGAARLAALFGTRPDARRRRRASTRSPVCARSTQRDDRADAGTRRAHPRRGQAPETARGRPAPCPGAQAALAYPDRIGLRRKGDGGALPLSGGAGAAMPDGDPLGRLRLIVVTDLDGDRREARIRGRARPHRGASCAPSTATASNGATSANGRTRTRRVEARRQEMLDALVLDDRRWDAPPPDHVARGALRRHPGPRAGGPGWSRAARLLRARIRYAGVGDMSDGALLDGLEDWAAPHLDRHPRRRRRCPVSTPTEALRAHVGWQGMAEVDRLAPQHWTSPLGRRLAIDYGGDTPEIAVRLQEVLGTTRHPTVGPDRPADPDGSAVSRKPSDPGHDRPARASGPDPTAMSARTCARNTRRHPWPEDPTAADPTLRAKPKRG